MAKDFEGWNKNKQHIHIQSENKLYDAREVWWCSLGINIGFEQDEQALMQNVPCSSSKDSASTYSRTLSQALHSKTAFYVVAVNVLKFALQCMLPELCTSH